MNYCYKFAPVIVCKLLSFQSSALKVWFMVFNATFNNISVTLWRAVLLVAETGVPGEKLSDKLIT